MNLNLTDTVSFHLLSFFLPILMEWPKKTDFNKAYCMATPSSQCSKKVCMYRASQKLT